jgi:hypothetical protein
MKRQSLGSYAGVPLASASIEQTQARTSLAPTTQSPLILPTHSSCAARVKKSLGHAALAAFGKSSARLRLFNSRCLFPSNAFSFPTGHHEYSLDVSTTTPSTADLVWPRPTFPLATVFLGHIRQQSNPNPHPSTTSPHTQPPPLLDPGQLLPPLYNLSMAHNGAITLSPPPHSARDFLLSHSGSPALRPTFSPAIVRTSNHYRHDCMTPHRPHSSWCQCLMSRPGMNLAVRIALGYVLANKL